MIKIGVADYGMNVWYGGQYDYIDRVKELVESTWGYHGKSANNTILPRSNINKKGNEKGNKKDNSVRSRFSCNSACKKSCIFNRRY